MRGEGVRCVKRGEGVRCVKRGEGVRCVKRGEGVRCVKRGEGVRYVCGVEGVSHLSWNFLLLPLPKIFHLGAVFLFVLFGEYLHTGGLINKETLHILPACDSSCSP